MKDPTIWNTPAAGCPACHAWRQHTDEERAQHHPYSRHGYDRKQWSHPGLDPELAKKLRDGSSASAGVGVNWPTGKVTHER